MLSLCWDMFQIYVQTNNNKDNEYPFPWTQTQRSLPISARLSSCSSSSSKPTRDPPKTVEPRPLERKRKFDSSLEASSPRLRALSAECGALGCISLKLCDLNAVAGVVHRHAVEVLENLFRQQEPLIFKIGFTHSPIWRWSNKTYGYEMAREKWSNMIIFYYSREPYSPAMLEASLIGKYGSACDAVKLWKNGCSVKFLNVL